MWGRECVYCQVSCHKNFSPIKSCSSRSIWTRGTSSGEDIRSVLRSIWTRGTSVFVGEQEHYYSLHAMQCYISTHSKCTRIYYVSLYNIARLCLLIPSTEIFECSLNFSRSSSYIIETRNPHPPHRFRTRTCRTEEDLKSPVKKSWWTPSSARTGLSWRLPGCFVLSTQRRCCRGGRRPAF